MLLHQLNASTTDVQHLHAFTVLKGDVDAILLTGGMANSKWFCNLIIERIHKIAPVYVYPGEDEMKALAENGALILNGEIEPKEYV
jgi:butyrate kinase